MKPVRALFALALPALFAGAAAAQAPVFLEGNDVQLSAGGTNVWIYNSPSVGGTLGAPVTGGDLAYKGVPQDRTTSIDGLGMGTGVNITELSEIFLGDVDWPAGAPDFYDMAIAESSAATGLSGDNLVPDFFTTGSVTAIVSLGNSGVPHPCVAAPSSTCTNSTQCPPLVSGYVFDINFASGFPALSGGDDSRGNHILTLLPAGMVFGATSGVGLCGTGDYVFMGAQSIAEAQADYLNGGGVSWCEGFQLGDPAGISPTGPLADAPSNMLEISFGLLEGVVEAQITDSGAGTPYGPVRGGASLGVDTSTGTATIAPVATFDTSYIGSFCFPAASLSAFPVGVSVFGANVMITPDGTFNSTFSAWAGTPPLAGVDEDGDGAADYAETTGIDLGLPVINGASVYLQAFAIAGFGPITADGSTRWRMDLQ
jgi:hypothetical protein